MIDFRGITSKDIGALVAIVTVPPLIAFSFGILLGRAVANWALAQNRPNQQDQPSLLGKGYNTAKKASLTVAKVFASTAISLLSVASQEHLVFGKKRGPSLLALIGSSLHIALDILGLAKKTSSWGPRNQTVKLVEKVCTPILKSFSYLVIPQTRRIGHVFSKIHSNFGLLPASILCVALNILIPCLIIKIANIWEGKSKIAKLARKVSSLMLRSVAYSSAIAASACTSLFLLNVLRVPWIHIPTFFVAGALFGGMSALCKEKCG